MKPVSLLMILVVFFSHYVYIHTLSCIKLTCMCVDIQVAPLIKIACPNENANKCYKEAKCKPIKGKCQFIYTRKIRNCLNKSGVCVKTGCLGTICSNTKVVVTKCLWKPWYICYKDHSCIIKKSGDCGWDKTKRLKSCLKKYNISN
jgi:hypothetical protein